MSAIDIPTTQMTHIVASTASDGNSTLCSVITDDQGYPIRRNSCSSIEECGISPTYYTSFGKAIQPSRHSVNHPICSPVYGDSSRVFFSHNSSCSCRGSGVGCDCTTSCSC